MKDYKTINKEDLKRKLGQKDVQVINVLEEEYYNLGLIKGSRRIPLSKLPSRLSELNSSGEVVTYCASYNCSASREAAELLAKQGYNVSVYEGGLKEWKASGLPVEGGVTKAA